jgi:AraC family transcriptional regulator, regulatory protein of adaptative response / methylated-DNA-[protein]-cysteine methyltransferase
MDHYDRIARVIRYLDECHADQPDLSALARVAGLSPSHFHRLFSAWAGVSPKDFLQALTLNHARALLRGGQSVMDAALDTGLSGPGRLHDLCVGLEAASPGELKSGGEGWIIRAGTAPTPFGPCMIAESPRGICHLAFVEPGDGEGGWAALRAAWPGARLIRDRAHAGRLAAAVFAPPGEGAAPVRLRACVRGTAYQVRVWRALLAIPPGTLVSYGGLARALGRPGSARAVGGALARNPVAYLIPCHRVIRETGVVGEYRWGRVRKQAMLAWESVHRPHETERSGSDHGTSLIQ